MTAGAWMVVAAAVLWGTLGAVFKILGACGASPVAIGFWRALLAGVVLAGTTLLRRGSLRVARADAGLFIAYGFVSVAVFYAMYPLAVHLSTVAVAAVLLYTAPAWVALMAAAFLGERLTARRVGAIAVTFGGCALVAQVHDPSLLRGNVLGVAAGLASGLTYATMGIFGRAALRRYPPATVATWALLIGCAFLLPVGLSQGAPFWAVWGDAHASAWMLYAGLIPTAGSFLLYVKGLERLQDAGRASVLATIEPLVAALCGYLVWNEALAGWQWAGGALILAGVVWLTRE